MASTTKTEMMFLIDTNIISELRRPRPSKAVVEWFLQTPVDTVFLSAVTIGELQAGAESLKDQDAPRAAAIETWITTVAETHNILPVDVPVFCVWACLKDRGTS